MDDLKKRSAKETETDDVVKASGLTVLEIAGLVKQLEEKWGVAAATAVPSTVTVPIASRQRLLESRQTLLTALVERAEKINEADLLDAIKAHVEQISNNLAEIASQTVEIYERLSHV